MKALLAAGSKAILAAAFMLLCANAGAAVSRGQEESFYASHLSEMQAQCEKPIAKYILIDVDSDGLREFFGFDAKTSMVSVFSCGGDKLGTLLIEVKPNSLRISKGMLRTWQPAGSGGSTFENFAFISKSCVTGSFSELSYEGENGRIYETSKDNKKVDHSVLTKLLPKDPEEWSLEEAFLKGAKPISNLNPGSKAGGSDDRIKVIRKAYSDAIALPKIDVSEARSELKMNVHRNVPAIGVQDQKVEFFGTTHEEEWRLINDVRLVRVSYNVAARKFYEEYLFDEKGEPMFCFIQFDVATGDRDLKGEKRYYFDKRAVCSFNFKAKDAGTGKEIAPLDFPELFDANDSSDVAERIADFDFYRNLFNSVMNRDK